MKKSLLALIFVTFCIALNAAVTYKLSYNSSTQTYTVSFKSTVAYSGPLARITGSTQFTIVAPDPDGTGPGAFTVTNLTNLTALQIGLSQLNSPAENTSKDYLFFAPTNSGSYTPFNIPADTYIDLFTFQTSSGCLASLYLFDNVNDPLNSNMSINADNNFKTLGGGNVNLYTGNDSSNDGCACVTFKLTLDPDGQTYRVSFNSGIGYSGALARITGSTQFTIVASDPDGAGGSSIMITNITNLTGLQMGVSQLNSPAENPSKDYAFFAPLNAGTYTPFNIPANTNIDLFTFKITGNCLGDVYLFDNTNDPLNSNMSINADNNFKTLGGGNNNLYCYNVGGIVPLPNPTITLGAISPVCPGSGTAGLPYSATTGGVDQYSIDFDAAAEAAGFVDVVNAALPSSPINITVPGMASCGTYNATLTVRNSVLNCVSNNYNIAVTLQDNGAPVITTCPPTQNLEACNTAAITGLVFSTMEVTVTQAQFNAAGGAASDGCGIVEYKYVDSQTGSCPIVVTRHWTVTDACGNSAECDQTINIDDTTNPTASNPAPVTVQCPADVPAPNVAVVTDEADNCTAVPTVAFVNDVSDGNTCPEVITRTYSVTDACGNAINVTQTITIDDTTNPTASNPAPVTVQCPADLPAPNVAVVTDEADNCTAAPTVAFVNDVSDGNTCPEVITRTYSVTDACGNAINVTQTITIDDTTNPTASNPAPVTVQCSADVPAPNINVVTDEADNCTAAPTVAFVNDVSDGNTCPEVITRTYSVTDACGNAINVTQTITIDDTTNPTASNPAPVTVQCPADVPAPNINVVTDEADNCTAAPTVVFVNDVSDGNTCPEVITRTYSVTDACGNQIQVTQTITIDDTTNPTASNPAPVTVQCPADVPAPNINVVTDEADNCTAAPTVAFVNDVSDGNTCPEVITRTYSVTDACGNQIQVTQTITIDDTTNPTASNPAPVTVQCVADVPVPNVAVVTDEADNCTAAPTVAFVSDVSDGNTCPEVITRTYSVTDACGNAINVTQTITIDDTTNPTASNPAPVTVQCVADVPAPNVAIVTDEADNCTAAPTVAFVNDVSDGNTCPEVITRTYSVTDACGNAINVTQTITIDDTTNPTASNPAPVTVQCVADVPAPNVAVVTDEADNCTAAPTVAFVSDVSDGNTCPEVITRTYSVTDACGNAINVTQTITIDDTTNPTASNPAPVTVQCSADVPAPNINVVTDEADNCTAAPTVVFVNDVSDGNTCPEVITRTYSVTDACGNAINVTQTITIDDTTNPTASNPAPVTVQCVADVPAPNVAVVTDEADNCTAAPTVAFVNDVSDGNTCPEVITRTYSVTDACGNAINVTQTITIDDTTNPTASNPAPVTVQCVADVPAPNVAVVTDEADNCTTTPTVAFVNDVSDGNTCPEVITRTYSVTDACGNAINVTQTITINDTTNPTASNPAPVTVQCPADVPAPNINVVTDEADNCTAAPTVVFVNDVSDGNTCPEVITRTYSVTDACGNAINVTQTITIDDTTNPTASNPAPVTVQCPADVPAPNINVVTDEADNCTAAPTVVFVNDVSDGNTCPEVITRTYSVTDACGNQIQVTQTITIDDTINPTASNPAPVTVQCPADVPAPNINVVTDEADNCTAAPTVAFVNDVSDGNTCPEVITRTYSVTDACGNQIQVTQTITIDDTTNPTASNPAPVTVQCVADVPAPNINVVTDEADNCTAAPTVAFVSDVSDGNTCPEVITRTYSVTDACGNAINVTQTITINDTTNPTASNPVPVTVQCVADVPVPNVAVVTDEADNCTAAPTVAFVSDVSDGNTCPEVITRTYSVTDACGNAINVTQTITINDTTNPTASNPVPVTVQCVADVPAPNVAVVTDEADNCTAAPTVAFVNDVSDGNTCPEVITRTYSVTDACGNAINVTQTITIDDTTNPTASNPAPVTVQCPADVPAPNVAVVTDEADNCTAAPTVAFVNDVSDGNTCPEVITRTYSVTDACGNQIQVTQTITIDDTTNPTASNPAPVTVQCVADVPAPNINVVTDEADNCTAAPTVAFVNDVSDGNTCPEVITRTYSVTDACGNAINVTQTITIDDTTNPTFTAPADMTIYTDANCNYDASTGITGDVTDESDNCSTGLTATFVDVTAPGACPGELTITRTWSLMDNCGNAAPDQVQIITVEDNLPPVITPGTIASYYPTVAAAEAAALAATSAADNCSSALSTTVSTVGECPATITVTVTDECGNSDDTVYTTSIHNIALNPSAAFQPVCAGGSVIVKGNASGGQAPLTHSWTIDLSSTATGGFLSATNLPDVVVEGYTPGTLVLNYTVTDNKGCSTSTLVSISVSGDCALFGIIDPCSCNDDASVDGDNGSFSELVAVTGPGGAALPAGQTWTIAAIAGAYTDDGSAGPGVTGAPVAVGTMLVYNAIDQNYFISFDHVDAQGYTVTVEGPNAPGTPGNFFMTVSNTCFYPHPVIVGPLTVCSGSDPFVLEIQGVDANANAQASPFDTDSDPLTTESVTWLNGNTGEVDPSASDFPGGSITIYYHYDAPDAPGTSSPGCDLTVSFTLNANNMPPLSLAVTTSTPVSCYGGSDGSVTVTATGGTAPYTYLWNDAEASFTNTGLSAGVYTVTATDANGCTAQASVMINEPAELTAVISAQTNVACNGASTGSATVTAGGGTPGYTYLWDNGQTTATATGLIAGAHGVTVTDANGCTAATTVLLTEPTLLLAEIISSENTSCNGASDGTATVNATGGEPGYTYLWDNGQTTATATGLAPGPQGVTVTDANGCMASASVTIQNGATLLVDDIQDITVCPGTSVNDILLVAQPANPAIVLSWSGGSAVGLSDGTVTGLNPAIPSFTTNNTESTATVTVNATLLTCTASIDFTITLNDATAPEFVNCPDDITLNNDVDECGAVVWWVAPSVTDNCGGAVTMTQTAGLVPGSFFTVGTPVVQTYTADDGFGNVSTCSFSVTVLDAQAPALQCPAGIQTLGTDNGVCWVVIDGTILDASASDNCPTLTLINDANNGASLDGENFAAGTHTIVWTATDASGNVATCSFTLNIYDDEAPAVVSCPADIVTGTNANNCTAVVNYPAPVFFDNCGGTPVLTEGLPSGAVFPLGTTTVTIVFNDNTPDNNPATCSFDITVEDDDDPQILCPLASALVDNTTGQCSYTNPGTNFDPIFSDNCGQASIQHDYLPAPNTNTLAGANLPIGITVVTWTAVDVAGNTATCSVEITVGDTEDPVFVNCPTTDLVASVDAGQCEANVNFAIPVATDNCSVNVTQTGGLASGASFPVGNTLVTFVATDPAGNEAECAFFVMVQETEPPTAVCQDLTIHLDASGLATITAADVDGGSNDNCGIDTRTIDVSAFDCTDLGDQNVTLTVTDDAGNASVCVATVSVADNLAPTFTCPAAQTAGSCDALVPDLTALVTDETDNCGVASVTQNPVAGTDFGNASGGSVDVTITVSDASGNTSTCVVSVTIDDDTAPVFANCSQNIVVGNDVDECGANVSFPLPTATDNCPDVTVVQTEGPASGSLFPLGTTDVAFEATDEAGNVTTCAFTVTVTDAQAPAAVCQDLTIHLDASGLATITAADVDGGSNDNCGIETRTIDVSAFDCTDLGDQNVTLTVTDDAGNASVCVATVSVADNLAPTFTCPAAQTAGSCDALVPDLTALVTDETDNCGVASVTQNPVAGTDFGNASGGSIDVTITVSDASGNTSTCVVSVTIDDDTAPVFANCSQNIVVGNDVDECGANVSFPLPTATDNCPDVTVVQTEGPASGSLFPLGTTDVTFEATDEAGNVTTCAFTVTVTDAQAPAAVCQDLTIHLDASGLATITAADVDGGSNDNCGIETRTIDVSAFDCTDLGDQNVTLTVTDDAGNASVCVATVSVADNLAPTFTCPAAQTASSCDALVPDLTALVTDETDNCGVASVTQNPVAGTDFGNASGGSIDVTITVSDASGNTATCVVSVTIDDDTAPVFANCPTNMVMVANDPDQCSGKINWTAPVATDNCGAVTVTQTAGPLSGTVVPVGAPATITYTATDAAGNAANCVFQIQVVDTQLPEFDADIVMPGDITVNCGQIPPPFVLTNSDVHDNCTTSQNLVISFMEMSTPNAPNPCGNTNFSLTRTWKVTDAAGNMLVHEQHITVLDTQAPIAVCQNITVTLNDLGQVTITPLQINNGSSDNCIPAQSLNLALNQTLFTCANLGENTVTLTVTDACGNFATCTAVVTVLQGNAPCAPQYDVEGSDPCVCLNNATNLDNGQFSEFIQIKSLANQTWMIQSVTNLYSAASPNPPAAPLPVSAGTLLTPGNLDGVNNDGDGLTDEADENIYYTFLGRHVDGIGYSATFVNNLNQSLVIANKCYYPTPVFGNLGTDPFCLNTPPFAIDVHDANGAQGVVTQITVNGMATNIFDAAALGEGIHTVTAIFDAADAQPFTVVNGQTVAGSDAAAKADPGCEQKVSIYVQIVGTPSSLVCNDLVHVSLDADCEETIGPDDVLEGTYYCFDDYIVEVDKTPPYGNGPWEPAHFTAADLGKTYAYHVVHAIGGNICWGNIKIEDKLAPALDCPNDITIACSESTDVSHTGNVAIEDCSTTTTQIDDEIVNNGDCSDPRQIITRTFIVTDAWGNQSTCSQTITVLPFDLDDVIFPDDITIDCEALYNNPNATAPANTGNPSINGASITGSVLCDSKVNYTDTYYDGCEGTFTILRVWSVLSDCLPVGPNNPVAHTQRIEVEDVHGPQFACPPAVTVSTDPFNCCATAALPDMIVSEGCSNISDLEAKVTGTNPANGNIITFTVPGYLTDFPGNNYWTPDTLAVFDYTSCLPLGDYTVRYTASDQCGNVSTCQFVLTVADLVPPVVACQEVTQVSIGAGGQVEVLASSFDSDTYDNCCLDSLLVRRMGTICGDTIPDDFDPSVFFCCDDIGDTVQVIMRATDCHGNYNECMIQVLVEDKVKPVCSAPANTTVSCENFDPSLWAYGYATGQDNCCLDTITVQNNYSLFDTVCNRGTITRTFRVFDCAGQSSQCTQRVFVNYQQDYFVKFPNDVIVTVCDGTGNFGEPSFFGEDCELLGVSFEDAVFTVVPDACFKIERTWTIINWCTYNTNLPCVYIPNPNPNPVTNSSQNLPGPIVSAPGTPAPWAPTKAKVNPTDAQQLDYSVFYAGGTYTDYSNNQTVTVPGIVSTNCLVYKQIIKVIDTQDPVVENCPDSLVEICDLTVNNQQLWNENYWWDAVTEGHDLCEGPTDVSITTTDACTGASVNIRYLLFLDTDGDGVMETVVSSTNLPAAGTINYGNASNPNFSGGEVRTYDERGVPANQKYNFAIQTALSGNKKVATLKWNTQAAPNTYVTPELPYGAHKIKWIVEDGCGNETVCEYAFEVKDCKAPTVVCYNGLSVNIMATGMIQLWATDFLNYAEDNCTPPTPYTAGDKLRYAIRKSGQGTGFPVDAQGQPITSVTFTCDEIGTQPVELWAMDLAGNAAYCETYVIVQDPDGICSPNGNATVAGFLETEPLAGADGVEDASIDLQGSHPALPPVSMFDLSNNQGYYAFGNALPLGSDYTVTPVKDDNPMNGVSTFDLVLISKHILGTDPLNSPYKIIAADANKSNSVTTFDILELRKLILGIYTELPNNTSWRFLDEGFAFSDPTNPFYNIPFAENVSVGDIQSNHIDDNFVGVKIGDVNGSVIANATQQAEDRSSDTMLLDVEDREVKAGDVFEVTFRTAEQVQGFQFTMNLNGLTVEDIVKSDKVGADNFGVFQHALTASIDGAAAFTVRFRAEKAGKLSEMLQLSSQITRAEAYNQNGQNLDVALRFSGKTIAGVGFELYQNQPNPWLNHTQIGFHLPQAATATLTVYDETGRVLFTQKGDFAKGYNAISLDRNLINTTSVLYYRLETATDSAVKKMIQTR